MDRLAVGVGDLAQARALLERALKIDEAALGPDHPRVATGLNNLALVLKDLGDLAQARTLLERALSILRKFLGDEHPNTQLVRRNLDTLIENLNSYFLIGNLWTHRFQRAVSISRSIAS